MMKKKGNKKTNRRGGGGGNKKLKHKKCDKGYETEGTEDELLASTLSYLMLTPW
jgi:hypothetical protein